MMVVAQKFTYHQLVLRRRRRLVVVNKLSSFIVILLCCFGSNTCSGLSVNNGSNNNSPTTTTAAASYSRRELLLLLNRPPAVCSSILALGTLLVGCPETSHAARGAAELDLEYYARDLIGGNKKEGNVLPSKPPDLPPPRTLQEPFLSLLLDDDDIIMTSSSSSCSPVTALIEQVKKTAAGGNNDDASVRRDIQRRFADYRDKSKRVFAARAMWNEEHVRDQYYFDLTSYALWRTAADMIPNYIDRDRFARQIGALVYDKCLSTGLIKAPSPQDIPLPVTATIPYMKKILDLFQQSGYCKGYRIGGDNSNNKNNNNNKDQDKNNNETPIFDDFDTEALMNGATIDCLVSVYEPASLGACLQITGEQSRFTPEYVATTLAAMWKSTSQIQSTWEIFFVDSIYRPNPKDYYPQEQLIQFTLSMSKTKQ